jgi:hypothetical protein
MAVKHKAYLFRRDRLESLLRQVTTRGRPDNNALLERLKQEPMLQPQTATDFMHDLGVSLAGMDGTESEEELGETLFLIALAGTLESSLTLTNRAFAATELALPLLGCSNEDTSLILCGRSAHEFVRSFSVPGFASAFDLNRSSSDVGWLSSTDIATCASRLDTSAAGFLRPDRHMLEKLAKDKNITMLSQGITAEELLKIAFQEIMARYKLTGSSELIVFNDIRTYGPQR